MSDENRRSGRTTRIVDAAIQELFNTGKCTVFDHFVGQGMVDAERASKRAAYLVARRLELEHAHVSFVKDGCKITLVTDFSKNVFTTDNSTLIKP